MSLNSSQIAVLATICTPLASQDDLTKYLNVPGRDLMIKALEVEHAKIQEAAATEAALSIISLAKQVDARKAELVEEIRDYRGRIDQRKKHLEDLDRLISYGQETGNYLPLVVAVEGYASVSRNIQLKDRHLLSVPEDWKPKADTSKGKATASTKKTARASG